MNRRLVLVLAVAGLAAVLGATSAADRALVPAAHAQDKVDYAAEWDKQWERAFADAAKEYEKLYKFCMDEQLESTAVWVRRRVLKWRPEDQEVRKFLGYIKQPDGVYTLNDDRKEQLRQLIDVNDPKATKLGAKELAAQKKIRESFKSLAKKAIENGTKNEPAKAAEWKEKETRAWNKVLDVDSANEEAHKALGHPKFDGKYCTPFALDFLKARAERKKGGVARAQAEHPVQAGGTDGILKAAGIQGGSGTGKHFRIESAHGPDVAVRVAKWAERALEDFVVIHGIDPKFKEAVAGHKYDIVKEKAEMERVLTSAGWDDKKIKKYLEHFSGMGIGAGEFAMHNSGSADADDMVMHNVGHVCTGALSQMAAAELGGGGGGIEDWLPEALAYDITRRLTGTTLTTCGAFGKYGNHLTPKPNGDIWMEAARDQVDIDDDVPLRTLWKKKMDEQQIRGPETVKGYAFIQFIYESDPEKARDFVRRALAQGTPKAVEDVYQISMDELDAKYREWILKTW